MLVVDTNVLVYAADQDSLFHVPCRDWLERQRVRADAGIRLGPSCMSSRVLRLTRA